jgi:hypothetical protein
MKKITQMVIVLVVLLTLPSTLFAQRGKLKIYSEIPNVQVYLDEILQGVNVTNIYDISVGSHYLKVLKDDVIIYGELLEINENTPTTVLIKNNKEIQDKLLAAKFKEIQQYKAQKIDLLLEQRFITTTSGNTSSEYYPGYYSILGSKNPTSNAQVSTTSETKTITDWFITQGGTKKISQQEFARITNDTATLNRWEKWRVESRIQDSLANIKQIKKSKSNKVVMTVIGIPLTYAGYKLFKTAHNNYEQSGKDLAILGMIFSGEVAIGGSVLTLVGLTSKAKGVSYDYTRIYNSYSLESASVVAFQYNLNLKKSLGLPEDFEPKQ